MSELLYDVLGVGHLRHAPRVDEARRFDPAQTCTCEPPDQLDLHLRREELWIVLETIARPDLHDVYLVRSVLHC
jgi:hypothetical protein